MISKKLWRAVKLDPRRDYKIAQAAGLHPTTLSRILNGIDEVQPGDERVIKIGAVVGIAEAELFDIQTA